MSARLSDDEDAYIQSLGMQAFLRSLRALPP